MKGNRIKEERQKIIDFIQKNPKTTYREVREKTKLHPERCFKSLKEAFKEAKINSPRTFERKTKGEKRKIITDYIRKHPTAGGHTIRKDTKINFSTLFKSIKDAYKEAGIVYPRKIDERLRREKKTYILNLIKENPTITIEEITEKIKVNPYNFFKSIQEIYKLAKIGAISRSEKRRIKKRQIVIEFIKNNPLATQREINKVCKTHVQELFKEGIFEAYEMARVTFAYERLKTYGIGLKEIRQRAKTFEDGIALKLSGFGKVNRLVKTKRGFADIILERKGKKAVIEVKDYELKDISISQINQLSKYLEDYNCDIGFLICYKKPKRDNFLIGKNKIFILEETELSKIPELIKGASDNGSSPSGSRKLSEDTAKRGFDSLRPH